MGCRLVQVSRRYGRRGDACAFFFRHELSEPEMIGNEGPTSQYSILQYSILQYSILSLQTGRRWPM